MEKKFNEREFLKAIKQLGEITTYFTSKPTAKRFLDEVIFPHCDCDEFEAYDYMNEKIMERIPAEKKKIFNLEGWNKFYNFIIKEYRECPKLGEFLSYGVNFFQQVDTYESYFRLATEILEIDADGLMNFYTIHTLGWIKVVDTLVKIANETLGETKKEEKKEDVENITSDACEETNVSEMEESSSLETENSQLEAIPEIEDSIQEGSGFDDETATPMEVVETKSTSVESEHADEESKELSHPKKSSGGKAKRGYNVPILQYRKVMTYEDVNIASEKSGISIDEILSSIATKPTTKVNSIWKYSNKQRNEVVQYTYFHTYKNLKDIDRSSKKVYGKAILHANVSPTFKKDWSPVSRAENIWIQSSSLDNSIPMESAA